MTITLERPTARRAARWLAACFAGGALLLAGCGGGGNSSPAVEEPPPAASAGDPVVATVDGGGSKVAFSASGVAGTLEVPEGTFAEPTTLTITPLAPATGEWLRLRIAGPRGVLTRPLTMTLTLPAGSVPAASAAGVWRDGAQTVPLQTRVDVAARTIVLTLQQFADAAPAQRAQAMAAKHRLAEAAPLETEIAALRTLSRAELYGVVEETIRVHEREQQFATAFKATAALTTVQMVLETDGGTPDPLGVGLLSDLKRIACANLAGAVGAATLVEVPAFGGGGLAVAQWRARQIEPVHYWQAIVARLGDGPCAGVDVDGALVAVEQRYRSAVETRLGGSRDGVTIAEVAPGLARAAALVGQDRLLGVPAQGEVVQQETLQPLTAPLRATAWDASANGTTHDHYRDVLRIYGLYSAFGGDLQMVGTSLYVGAYEGGSGSAAMGSGSAGGGAGPNETRTATTVPARAGGSVELKGPITVLHCPAAATETLVVEFEGVKVLERASVGDSLLDGTLTFDVSTLLAAAAIDPATRGLHTLQLKRVGSSCNAALGATDAVLVRVTLDFAAGQPPEPSKITGKRFAGSVVEYYMPYDNPECSRTCLERNPGSDRCPVSASFVGEITVTGDPRAYSATYRWRITDPPEAPWLEAVFAGSGTANSFGGSYLPPGSPSVQSLYFSVDESGRLVGQSTWRCHLQEITLTGTP